MLSKCGSLTRGLYGSWEFKKYTVRNGRGDAIDTGAQNAVLVPVAFTKPGLESKGRFTAKEKKVRGCEISIITNSTLGHTRGGHLHC